MKVTKINEGTANEMIKVADIEGDMGGEEKLFLIQEPDGDVIVGIQTPKQIYSVQFCSSSGGGRIPAIAKKLRELIAELIKFEVGQIRVPTARIKVGQCTAENPCCGRRGEYNGFASGPLKFVCPKHCSCHD